jgi:hypothetical protein
LVLDIVSLSFEVSFKKWITGFFYSSPILFFRAFVKQKTIPLWIFSALLVKSSAEGPGFI